MTSHQERRAAALEAIGRALLELAALEREPDEPKAPTEILIDHRNCEAEIGLTPRAFTAAAGRDFPAFRVSKRLTATKADVLTWLKSRTVEPKRKAPPPPKPADPDALLHEVHKRFVARVGRPMTDWELDSADICIDVGRHYAKMTGGDYTDTADDIARRVQEKIGKEPTSHADWRSLGLDPAKMEKDAEALRLRLFQDHPELTWRDRVRAVYEMWDGVTAPLREARRAQRAAVRAAKKAERAAKGALGLKRP